MFIKRKSSSDDIREGAIYQHERDGRVVEVAKVVSIYDDRDGIPHVRFEMSYQRSTRSDYEGLRVLAREVFAERYRAKPDE